jgi:hypothetical protein
MMGIRAKPGGQPQERPVVGWSSVSRRIAAIGLLGCLAWLVLLAGPVRPSHAGQESATADIEMTPLGGTLFREVPRPVNWQVQAELTTPWPEEETVIPLKRIRVTFPEEMSFNPDPRMPVCSDSRVGPAPVNMSVSPAAILARCPKSVVGNGTSVLYLGRDNKPSARLDDGVLIIFNGGRNPDGSARLKVYGFSATLAIGVYIEGRMRRNRLDVVIPYLTADSSVGAFNLNIPGSDSPFPGRRGLDPRFVRATCADGVWDGSASFTLGNRDLSGNESGPESVVDSPPVSKPCSGVKGSPRLRVVAATRRSYSPGLGRSVYAVTLRNSGTATARGILVRAQGRRLSGSSRVPALRPGTVRRVRVVVRGTGPYQGRQRPSRPSFRVSLAAG